jgi:hypothetical protein
MSIRIISLVWQQGPKDRSQRLLMLAIADCANDQGFCWPSVATLAVKSCMSERTALRSLRVLEEEGWLKIARKSHEHKGNSYEIDLGRLGDTVSHDNSSHDKLSHDKTGSSQVTKRAKSGDKTGNPLQPPLGRTVKNRKEPSCETAKQLRERVVQSVWAYYCVTFDRTAEYVFSDSRRHHAERGFDVLVKKAHALAIPPADHEATILGWFETAIHRLADSDFHNGKNDRKKTYNDFENLFSSQEHKSPDHLTDYWLNDEKFGEK